MSLEFLLITFLITASPGTGVVYTVAMGLSRGSQASMVAALGCTLGIVPHLIAALLGLSALLHASSLAFNLLKYAGVAYLLYMAWQMARDRSRLSLTPNKTTPQPYRHIITEAILINVLNPKLSLFFFAFLPQFIQPNHPQPLPLMLALSLSFMLMTLVVFVLYGLFAAALRQHVLTQPSIMQGLRYAFAATFAALAVKLFRTDA